MDTPGTKTHGDALDRDGRTLSEWISQYRNERAFNTQLFTTFDCLARAPDWLAEHRDWVEANEWGFGDRAFHHMWYLILDHLSAGGKMIRCLEIGVFKGQIVSLWALIAAQRHFTINITALSPFSGSSNSRVKNRFVSKLFRLVNRKYRTDVLSGNIYAQGEYLDYCEQIFRTFDLAFSDVEVLRGLSTDPSLLETLEDRMFDLIYIDGDHSEAGAMQDVRNFAHKVSPGGLLVMDDAALSLEIDLPYRGRIGPTRAADELPSLGFRNVLNIGHNRVFEKL